MKNDPDLKLSKPPLLIIGGLDIKDQRRKLLIERPLIVVGTPGRVKEMIERQWIGFQDIDTVIIDEADKFCVQNNSANSGWKGLKKGQQKNKFFEDLCFLMNEANRAQP